MAKIVDITQATINILMAGIILADYILGRYPGVIRKDKSILNYFGVSE